MAENVRVVVRCRPMNSKEKEQKCKNIVEIQDCAVSLRNSNDNQAPNKTFTYDNAYDIRAPTEALYNDICYALVENVLEGYNGTIFAYGQTGCGKSHTMQGPELSSSIPKSQSGIISRSFDHIFEAISVATSIRYLALVSYLEIYNENIRDLLKPDDAQITNHQLKEIPGEGVIVQSLSTHTVHNAKECEELLRIGSKNRMVGATLMNAGSSRSHSIFTISLEQIDTELSTVTLNENLDSSGIGNGGIKKGKLNLVDLAGSERQNKTGAMGDRLKEATKINLSLSALGNVISALVDGKTKHIPYRDSKLTRLLQDSLGGNTKTLMIACISPADYNYDETLSTLRYASRAKNIHNKPKINEDPKDTMMREYQEEIMKLKKLLESNSSTVKSNDNVNGDQLNIMKFDQSSWLEEERSKLRSEYEEETERLKIEHDAQQKEKEDLVRNMELLKTHYEKQLKQLATEASHTSELNNNNLGSINLNNNKNGCIPIIQQEALNRIEMIKNALIGGERANDVQLKEKRNKKKLAAQRRLSALAHALSRVEQSSDRDLLQEHYTDIQQELKIKNEALKTCRQKVRALDREVSDLQSEFQLDRADYLETIRRLERNLKFYQQMLEKALPILRKDGKYWDPNEIQSDSVWNDDVKKWKLPEDSMNRFKLPPAASAPSASSQRMPIDSSNGNEFSDDDDIAENYFRPRRTNASDMIQQRKGSKIWRDVTIKTIKNLQKTHNNINTNINSNWINLRTSSPNSVNTNSVLASWLPQNHIPINKTFYGLPVGQNSSNCMSSSLLTSASVSNRTQGTATNFLLNSSQHQQHLQHILPPTNPTTTTFLSSAHPRQNNNYELSSGTTTTASDINLGLMDTVSTNESDSGFSSSDVLQQSSTPTFRIKSTSKHLIVNGQQRRPRHLRALKQNERIPT